MAYARQMPGMIQVHKIRDRYWTNTTQYVRYIKNIAIRHVDTTNILVYPGIYHTYSWYQSIRHKYCWTRFIYRVALDHPCISWYKVYSRHIHSYYTRYIGIYLVYTWYIPGIYYVHWYILYTMHIQGIYQVLSNRWKRKSYFDCPCPVVDGCHNLIHVLGCCEIRSDKLSALAAASLASSKVRSIQRLTPVPVKLRSTFMRWWPLILFNQSAFCASEAN